MADSPLLQGVMPRVGMMVYYEKQCFRCEEEHSFPEFPNIVLDDRATFLLLCDELVRWGFPGNAEHVRGLWRWENEKEAVMAEMKDMFEAKRFSVPAPIPLSEEA